MLLRVLVAKSPGKRAMHYTEEPKFKAWKQSLIDAGCTVRGVTPLKRLEKRNGELLFGLFDVDATDPSGRALLNYVVIRGNACVIVPLLRNRDTGEEKYVTILQRRTGNGRLNLEFPAGMLDRNLDDPVQVAVDELREETGLNVQKDNMLELWPDPLYTSVGLQDEAILYYGCVAECGDAEFRDFEGRKAGNPAEQENITVVLRSREEILVEASSVQVILGLHLFERRIERGSEHGMAESE